MNTLYTHPSVRARLADYIGGGSSGTPTAAYVTQSDGCRFDRKNLRPAAELNWFLERDLDIARSLADSQSLLLHLDMEYVNFDTPAEAYAHPGRAFELQEPAVQAIETLLNGWGIQPLHVLTGQGHHFVWSVPRDSFTAAEIAGLCPAPELLADCDRRIPGGPCRGIDSMAQRAFGALGLLMEFVAHRIKKAAVPHCSLPVEITAVHVGPGRFGQREIISIDTSEYGDPLHTRMVRMPFTSYLKPWATGLMQACGLQNIVPPLWAIPLQGMSIAEAIEVRKNESRIVDLACSTSMRIPDQEAGTARLLADYLASPLRRFHEFYYAAQHDPRESWPQTYGRTPLCALPLCVSHILTHPNDLLLKPAGLQIVTRSLLAAGWHPRHIAGLVRSKFEDPVFQWQGMWNDYEPATRADFYVRLFAGLQATGMDRLVDMNCVSTCEKGFCFKGADPCCGLESGRQTLLSR
jgi:hypothetical protein